MRKILSALPAALLLALSAPAAHAQTCPTTQSTPGFTSGGNLFGRIAAQWNAYFAAKVDANNGTLCNPTVIGTINLTFAEVVTALGYVPTNSTAQIPAHTYQGNNTAASAVPQPITNTQVAADLPAFIGDAGSGGTKGSVPAPATGDAAANKVLGAAGGWVAPTNFPSALTPQGRLTLTTATPVMSSTVSGATTIFYTPYVGSIVPFYDGTRWTNTVCPELSNVTTNSSTGNAGPAAVAASSNYDLFVWNNGGSCVLTRGPAWTNNTTRSLTFARQDGILLNTSTITNGPAASRGTWIGTVASNGSSTIDYIFGGSASGGTAARFAIWNAYNRVLTRGIVADSGTLYTYSSATIRQARASAGNQVAFLLGDVSEGAGFAYAKRVATTAASGSLAMWGVGLDSTTTFVQVPSLVQNSAAAVTGGGNTSAGDVLPGIGVHTLSANEASDGTNAASFDVTQTDVFNVVVRN